MRRLYTSSSLSISHLFSVKCFDFIPCPNSATALFVDEPIKTCIWNVYLDSHFGYGLFRNISFKFLEDFFFHD
jgi:hypothetical protein